MARDDGYRRLEYMEVDYGFMSDLMEKKKSACNSFEGGFMGI